MEMNLRSGTAVDRNLAVQTVEEAMKHRLLANELYTYLIALASDLQSAGDPDTARQVIRVSKFASGSTSELYGEARLLLPRIAENPLLRLSESSRSLLRNVIARIEDEFRRIGGG